MALDSDASYRALRTRDPRFDGRIFVAVRTTRIYCRPVCPARTARRENVQFHPSAAAAEAAGFRPCLRCRPELAPGYASIDAGARLLQTAIARIEGGALETQSLGALARGLGISDRHLRRVFLAELGVSPVDFAQTSRLLLAKRLLTDTRLPVTDVAYAAGFRSLRRFNALFAQRYRMPPAALRRRTANPSGGHNDGHRLRLGFRPPYDWEGLIRFLQQRTLSGVEQVDARRYQRTLRIVHRGAAHAGWISVMPGRGDTLDLQVSASLGRVLPQVLARARSAFDLGSDPRAIDTALGALATPPGVRVPGCFDGFELSVRAILGQQVSVAAANRLATRLVRRKGTALADAPDGLERLFPDAAVLAACEPRELVALGIIRQRATAVIALAKSCCAGALRLDPEADLDATLQVLRDIPGIGPWTCDYIALRALRWPDAFPEGDVALQRALHVRTARAARERAARWQPWRGYAAIHLWRRA